MPRVVMDWFWEHEAPIPVPKEQVRIVELLDEADRLRRLRREADANKAARIFPRCFLSWHHVSISFSRCCCLAPSPANSPRNGAKAT